MKKKIITTAVSLLTAGSFAHAGTMGPVSTTIPSSIPFVSLEGSYTWNQIDGTTIDNHSPNKELEPWGGRLAAGYLHPYSDKLRFSAEFGGGYYGSKVLKHPAIDLNNRVTIDGYDVLLGALYAFNQFDLFGSVGAMAQNNRINLNQDLAKSIPGGLFSGKTTTKLNQTQILPEIKVGGIYNLSDKLGISLAYLHVFGSDSSGSGFKYATSGSIVQNGTANYENPTLNSIMLGVRYSIV